MKSVVFFIRVIVTVIRRSGDFGDIIPVFYSDRKVLKPLFPIPSPSNSTKDIPHINDDIVLVSWKFNDESVTPPQKANVAIAAIARLRLYSYFGNFVEKELCTLTRIL